MRRSGQSTTYSIVECEGWLISIMQNTCRNDICVPSEGRSQLQNAALKKFSGKRQYFDNGDIQRWISLSWQSVNRFGGDSHSA